MIAEGK